jgi:metallo-beta-lactamase class B
MSHKIRPALGLVTLGLLSSLAFSTQTRAAADVPEALPHVAKATALAGQDLTRPLFLCQPDGIKVVAKAQAEGAKVWLEPTKAFDNLFFVGNEFVGVWILRTREGLVLFDSSQSTDEARDHLVPGLRELGLDPAQIRYVIVTHAHWDHYGGAKYLHDTYGARVGLSEADWTLLSLEAPGTLERRDRTPPAKDFVITDGQKLTLGDTTVTFYITPGHTPGTVSAIIPAREGDKTFNLSLLGSTAFPPTLESTNRTGGLLAYDRSVKRLAELSKAAGAVGLLNTHIFVDGSTERLAAAQKRAKVQKNPFVLGEDAVRRYYGILDECLQAAAKRPLPDNDWAKPILTKTSAE